MRIQHRLSYRLLFVGILGFTAHCAGSDKGSADDAAVTITDGGGDASATVDAGRDAATGSKANIVFILTDDLSWNLVQYMPHVLQMQQKGTTFSHYFVTDSLCCPSRSSIFTGKYPHNTGVFTNTAPAGGYAKFERRGNAVQSFSTILEPVGYKTAMMGKYLNGYEPKVNQQDPGWREWDVAGEGYGEYDYSLNE